MEESGIQSPPDQDMSDDIENDSTAETVNSDVSSSDTWNSSDISLLTETGNSDDSSSDTWHSSDDSLPTRSFPARICPGTSLPYKCSYCDIRYVSQELLVAHALEDDGGFFSCSRHYQQWKQDRQHDRKERSVLLIKPTFQRFPGLGIWRTITKVNDGDDIKNESTTETGNSDVSSSDTWNSSDSSSDRSVSSELSEETETGNSEDLSSDTWLSSDDFLPTMSLPALQLPETSLSYKCAHCGHRYASEELLVAHVVEGYGGDCCRYYQEWKKYREYQRKEKRVFLTKPMVPQSPGPGICQNITKADDDKIPDKTDKRCLKKRKIEGGNGCHPTKRKFF